MLPIESTLSYADGHVLMIAGTMGTVAVLSESKMPALIADLILVKVPNVKWAIVTLSLFAGIVSAFIDNTATVLMIAPIALAITRELDISPVGKNSRHRGFLKSAGRGNPRGRYDLDRT